MMCKEIWISVYIFYSDLDFLIKKGVYPLICNNIPSELLKKYFFIRYNVKGSHIRLRILCKKKHEFLIRNIIDDFFEEFFKTNQSKRLKEISNLIPNNSILYEEYIPEKERYGGDKAIILAEDHFYECSKTIINKMVDMNNWNIGIAQAFAIQLYVVFFNSIKLKAHSLNKMMDLMNNNNWKVQAIQITNNKNIEDVFLKIFNQNQDTIYSIVKSTQEILSDDNHLISNKIFDFQNSLTQIDATLTHLSKKNEIAFGFKSKVFIENDGSDNKSRIYISYLHMLNNRLGLKNYDEAYMSFILRALINEKKIT